MVGWGIDSVSAADAVNKLPRPREEERLFTPCAQDRYSWNEPSLARTIAPEGPVPARSAALASSGPQSCWAPERGIAVPLRGWTGARPSEDPTPRLQMRSEEHESGNDPSRLPGVGIQEIRPIARWPVRNSHYAKFPRALPRLPATEPVSTGGLGKRDATQRRWNLVRPLPSHAGRRGDTVGPKPDGGERLRGVMPPRSSC